MADILVKHNQAENDLQSWSNLKARHMGFSEEANGFWFKKADGSEDGLPVLVPTTIGQGMGRRYAQAGHGFTVKQLIRWTGTAWTLALATDDASTLATHMVVRVVDADEFDVARMGAWTLGGSPNGDLYLSATLAGSTTTVKPASPALVQRVAVGDGLAYHLTFDLPSGGAAYLPLTGGTMGDTALIQYEETADQFQAGMYWGGPNWARISRWGLIWNGTETRSGIQLYPVVGGGSYFGLQRRNSFENDVELYGHGDGGYMNLKGATGRNAVSLGAEPGSGNGSLYTQNGSGQWTISHSSSADAQYSVTNLRTVNAATELLVAYALRINGIGKGFLTALEVTSLTEGKIPLAGVSGLLGNSSLSEDATSVKSTKPIDVNGAARPAWAFWAVPLQLSNESAVITIGGSKGDQVGLARNFYTAVDGFQYPVTTRTAGGYPTQLMLDDLGRLRFLSSMTAPTVGSKITDLVTRWRVENTGQLLQWASLEPVQSAGYSKTATTTVSGTTAETSLLGTAITVPAGRLNIAGLLSHLKLKGTISASGTTLVTWRVKINGITVATNAVTRNWDTSFWRIEGDGTTRTTGATGTRQWDVGLYANADNANAQVSYYDLSWLGTQDLTAAATLDVTVQPAATTTTITCTTAFLKHS